ncbi:uncharacterized protein LOC121718196 isoform X2 [Alosa sapidissima]|uniref:uncharacterized protein LOC121718196 isoform X2 n=1 Tax=Alosa sapidissima TaxID=34773 RepID=UPI001C0926ED|nr:uncharacterized protein LOC121718196 isoform X2 [Alosa sapidissima]
MAKHYRPELKAHLSGGVPPTPPTSPPPPRPPTFPPPQCPPQDTTGTALSASSTKNRKADYHVQPQKTSQGLRPVRPPPPPPTKARHLTRQKTIDEYQSTVEPMYVEPDELHIRAKTEPAEEPLYITVLPDPPFNTQPQRLHHSVSESPDGPWSNSISPSPPVPAERQKFQHQLSLPARLPQGLETSRHISKEELEILLEWWNTAKETERIYHQFDENNLTMISNEAHRVRLALHLFEGLLFFRGQIFNDHITQLYCMADKLDKLHKKTRIAGIAGGTSGAVGGGGSGRRFGPGTFYLWGVFSGDRRWHRSSCSGGRDRGIDGHQEQNVQHQGEEESRGDHAELQDSDGGCGGLSELRQHGDGVLDEVQSWHPTGHRQGRHESAEVGTGGRQPIDFCESERMVLRRSGRIRNEHGHLLLQGGQGAAQEGLGDQVCQKDPGAVQAAEEWPGPADTSQGHSSLCCPAGGDVVDWTS